MRNETKTSAAMFDQPLPANYDAEMGVLGSVILLPEVMDEIASVIRPDDFLDERHAKIFRVLRDRYEAGKKIDVTLLVDELKRLKIFDEVGGYAYMGKLAAAVPHAAHAVYYANIVREKATYRTLIRVGTKIIQDAYSEREESRQVANNAEQEIFEVVNSDAATKETNDVRTVLHETMDRIDSRCEGSGEQGVKTGFTVLDNMTNGLQKQQLVILAARPSHGKSALALNIAMHVAVEESLPVMFISLEMAEIELGERMLCAVAKVNGHRLKQGTISKDDRGKLREAAAKISLAPLFVDDNPGLTVTEISAKARRVRRKAGGLSLLVVDYLQLIEPDDPRAPRQEQVSRISRRLKLLAKQLDCPVLCLAQLNRQVEQAKDSKPKLSHLRESGAIEQDADVVMFIHREETDGGVSNQAEIIVAKQRSGPTGDCPVLWQRDYTRFVNLAAEWQDDIRDFNRSDSPAPVVTGSWTGGIPDSDDEWDGR